ncbi:MAG: formylglycine-generating enzyme family protein [Candidatus Kapabacteria bacterium]|nr:formylglycine-generating enzyme family protein [Candidatus Kapabacteria bacterium]
MKNKSIFFLALIFWGICFLTSCSDEGVNAVAYTLCSSGSNISGDTIVPPIKEDRTIIVKGVEFTMKYVEGGIFWMGAQSTNPTGQNYDSLADIDESPVHQVTIIWDCLVGETEVTQALWEAVMGTNPSYYCGSDRGSHPVEQVSWNDVYTFINKLNALTGLTFRLPTDAEWEYVARGGNMSKGFLFSGSNTVGEVAWYVKNCGDQSHPVGKKLPNELGIFDMSGNVWEWCEDDFHENYYGAPSDGSAWIDSPRNIERIQRGGGWAVMSSDCRIADRHHLPSEQSSKIIGFRLLLVQ